MATIETNDTSDAASEVMLRLYKCRIPSCSFVFKNGKSGFFVNGRYATSIDTEIQELDFEVKSQHPHIYVDSAESEVSSKEQTPYELMKEKIRAELIAEMAAANNPDNDRGTSTTATLMPANTADVAATSAGGSGETLTTRIASINIKK